MSLQKFRSPTLEEKFEAKAEAEKAKAEAVKSKVDKIKKKK